MQALPRAPASPARSENHRLLALAAPLVRGSAGALRRLLMLGLLKRFARFVALTGAALLLLALPQAAAASRTLSLAAAALPGGATILPAAAQARLPQPIYFWSNIPEPVSPIFVSNPLVIRPSTFLLFEDGQWVLQDMHWTGWGSRVASATGISSSSNDIPNAASGKRIKTWARVTLSNPGRFQGREVYRCFKLTVPPPAHDGPLCLAHSGSVWLLASHGSRS